MGWITNAKHNTDNVKKTAPKKLKKRNLNVNETKTEEYTVTRNGDEAWKDCKYLGSKLDTEKDINRRKGLAICTYNKISNILQHKKLSINLKIRAFRTYIESIFLYNSEIWTLTKSLSNKVDVFQRKLLRRMLNIKWQDKVTNEDLYRRTKLTPWSTTIKGRRISFYGHVMRLPEDTPVRKAIDEAKRAVKMPRGQQKLTWLKLVERDLKELGIEGDGMGIAQDRLIWRKLVTRAMSAHADGKRY